MTRYSESSAPKQDEWDIARRAIECTRCNSWTSSERRQKKKRMYCVHNNRILRKRTKQWMHTFGTTLKTNSQLEYFHNTIQWFLLDKMHRDRASKRLKRNDSIKLRMRNKLSQSFVVVTKENTKLCNYYDFHSSTQFNKNNTLRTHSRMCNNVVIVSVTIMKDKN